MLKHFAASNAITANLFRHLSVCSILQRVYFVLGHYLIDMKKSKDKYVICTEKDLYKQDIRRIPGIPLIYFNRSVLTLDQPSKNSDHFVDSVILYRIFIIRRRFLDCWVYRMLKDRN